MFKIVSDSHTSMWIVKISIVYVKFADFLWVLFSFSNKVDRHDLTEILLKAALSIIPLNRKISWQIFKMELYENELFNIYYGVLFDNWDIRTHSFEYFLTHWTKLKYCVWGVEYKFTHILFSVYKSSVVFFFYLKLINVFRLNLNFVFNS